MIKRAYIILLPVIALLVAIYSNGNNDISAAQPASALTINNAKIKANLPFSFDLKKDNKKDIRNKIRIKAWDDFAAVEIVPASIPVTYIYIQAKEVFSDCNSFLEPVHHPGEYLRGPPELI